MVLMREAYCRRVSYFQPGPAGEAPVMNRRLGEPHTWADRRS
jgi:hypothetical protein